MISTDILSVRSGLCTANDLGSFITSLPSGTSLNSTSIFTSALKFSASSFPSTPSDEPSDMEPTTTTSADTVTETGDLETGEDDDIFGGFDGNDDGVEGQDDDMDWAEEEGIMRKKQMVDVIALDDMIGGVGNGVGDDNELDDGTVSVNEEPDNGEDTGRGYDGDVGGGYGEDTGEGYDEAVDEGYDDDTGGGYSGGLGGQLEDATLEGSTSTVPIYSAPITYAVRKTGYYCIGESLYSATSNAC